MLSRASLDLSGLAIAAVAICVVAGCGPASSPQIENAQRVVLRGRAVDTAGRAFACDKLMLVPHYVGSGPVRIEAATDADGRFVFGRAVLALFELVPHSLDYWHPKTAGNYLRIAQTPHSWVATAQAGGSIDVRVEPYTLVPVSIDVSALQATSVHIWKRWQSFDAGTVQEMDPTGHVQILMEQDVKHELWVSPASFLHRAAR